MDNNNNSGVNTILIVVVLVAIVGFGVLYFTGGVSQEAAPAEDDTAGFQVNFEAPTGDNESEGNETPQ